MRKRIWTLVATVLVLGALLLCLGCTRETADTAGMTQDTRTVCQIQGHQWTDADCLKPQICALCGESSGNPLGHDLLPATCTEPAVCNRCGETVGQALSHDMQVADCEHPAYCSRCDYTEAEALGHAYLPATCTEPETCTRCGMTRGEVADHVWQDATCDAPKTCSSCGQTEGEKHDWAKATCAAPKTCIHCGRTEGGLTDHKWKKATCEKPRTCTVCGETTGEVLGHEWKAATCVAAKTCTKCGKTSGTALGHDFAPSTDGETKTCYTCGETVKIKCVAITFDDGPSGKVTKSLLEGLAALDAKATFFICGYRIESFPKYPQYILDYGHEIGLHTYNHATLTKLDADGVRKELLSMIPLLPEGHSVTLMRPPGGAYNATTKQVCEELGMSIIMWSVDPKDWATNDVDTIVNRIVNGVSNGSIILMHDLKKSSVQAALKAIEILQGQGYEFVTVSELAAIQGKPLKPGKVYNSLHG